MTTVVKRIRAVVGGALLVFSSIPFPARAALPKAIKGAGNAGASPIPVLVFSPPAAGPSPVLSPPSPLGLSLPAPSPLATTQVPAALASPRAPLHTAGAPAAKPPDPTTAHGPRTIRILDAAPLSEKTDRSDEAAAAGGAWAPLLNWSDRRGEAPSAPAVGDGPGEPAAARAVSPLRRPARALAKALGREPALDSAIAPYRGKIRLAAFLKAAGAGLTLLNASLIGALVQHALARDMQAAAAVTAVSLAVLIASIPLRHWADTLQGAAGAGAVDDLRRTIFSRLIEKPSFRSGGTGPGVLASRVKDDPVAVEQIGVRLPARKLTALLMLSASTVLLFMLHPLAAFVALGAFGLIRAVGAAYGRVTRGLFDGYQKESAELNAHLVDVFENADTVASYGKQRAEAARLSSALSRMRSILLEGVRAGARWRSLEEVFALPLAFPGAFVVALLLGLPVGAAITMAFYAGYVYGALGELTEISSLSSQYAGAAASIRRLLTAADARVSEAPPGALAGAVRADALSFSYEGGGKVLDRLGFEIPPGSLTAIAGPSGAGKTTLLRIIAGLDSPRSGRLLIDGIDANLLRSEEWRRQIGYVPQDSGLLKGTIRENLKYGKSDASDAELEKALRSYGAGFLLDDGKRFPEGIDTPVGPKGAGLSGGQAQLVALIRALLNRPRLLLLDEPTASMDAEMEAAIWAVLQDLRAGKFGPPPTIIIVTHRQAAVQSADMVLRLDPPK